MTVHKGETLFPRIDLAKEMELLSAAQSPEPSAAVAKPEEKKEAGKEKKSSEKEAPEGVSLIGIDDFSKIQLRVAQIWECVPVEKSDKLLKLQLDDGQGGRQVVSGIAKWYQPEELIGKKVILVANLKPAKLRGVESMGMLLAASMEDGSAKVVFIDGDVPNGAEIG